MAAFYLKMFGISLLLTLFIEMGLAYSLRIRGKSLLIVALVNILTNPAIVFLTWFFGIGFPLEILPEICVMAIEGLIYFLFNKREGYEIKRPFIYSAVFNALSYGAGIVLQLFTGGSL